MEYEYRNITKNSHVLHWEGKSIANKPELECHRIAAELHRWRIIKNRKSVVFSFLILNSIFTPGSLGFTDYAFPLHELSAVESLTEKNKLKDGKGRPLASVLSLSAFPLISCLRWLSLPFFQFQLSDYEVDLPSSFHSVCMRGSEVDVV